MNFVFHAAAEVEHLEAVAYYESERPGLGASYLADFERVMEVVCREPGAFRLPWNRISDVPSSDVFRFRSCTDQWATLCKFSPLRINGAGPVIGSDVFESRRTAEP